jgi:uncharacterized protein YbaR (Trm112 family)
MKIPLACPSCHHPLKINQVKQSMVCENEKLIFSIIDGIPVLIMDQSKPLDAAS